MLTYEDCSRTYFRPAATEIHWGLDYIALLAYMFIDFSRLQAMYPVLAPLQLGKVTLLAAMLGALVSPATTAAQSNWRLKAGIVALAITTCLSGVAAHYTTVPASSLWTIPERLIVVFLIGRSVTNRWREKGFLFLIMALMLKVAQHGLRTYFFEHGRAVDEMAFVKFGIIGGGGGFYDNSADLGVAMCVVFGLSFALCQVKGARTARIFYLVCTLAFGALIVVCGSRGAVVGGAAIIVTAWVKSPRKSWAAAFVLLFVAALVFLMPKASKQRFENAEHYETDQTSNHRVELWRAGVRMWKDYPLLGVGPGNFKYVRRASYHIDSQQDADTYVCHSLYIEVLAELGSLGTLSVVVIFIAFFLTTRNIRRRLKAGDAKSDSWELCLCSGCELAMIGYLASGAFVSVFWYPHIWVLSGLVMGLNRTIEMKNEANDLGLRT